MRCRPLEFLSSNQPNALSANGFLPLPLPEAPADLTAVARGIEVGAKAILREKDVGAAARDVVQNEGAPGARAADGAAHAGEVPQG